MDSAYYLKQLEEELVVALGCTEPVAVAYAAALARKEAGDGPVRSITLRASVNIYKNAMGVYIPGTHDMGVPMAAALGALAGHPDRGLQVLEGITPEDVEAARAFCDDGQCHIDTAPEGTPALYIEVCVATDRHTGHAIIAWKHDLIMELGCDETVTFQNDTTHIQEMGESITPDDLRDIHRFATTVDLDDLDIIRQAIALNDAIAREGMAHNHGLEVGRAIAESNDIADAPCDARNCSLADHCAAWTAAASDARMAGVPLPAMSNSGSGNQGITVTVCVTSAARYLGSSEEALLRAQTLSQLVAIHVKKSFGRLSPLCGATAAGIGASAGIVMLMGGGIEEIIAAVQNMFGTLTGMICDGAKLGCSLKISACVYAAVQSALVAMRGKSIRDTDGVIEADVEHTIRNIGRISKEGMTHMDDLLLNIMLNKHQNTSC